jgi:TfoX N-terminal domain
MAHDTEVADTLRAALAGIDGIEERRMFGALAFMLRGNMLCGALADGGFFRVGPDRMAEALAVDGAAPMMMGARPMTGFVRVPAAVVAGAIPRARLLALASEFVGALPPKQAARRTRIRTAPAASTRR